jgi:hypothetical protein
VAPHGAPATTAGDGLVIAGNTTPGVERGGSVTGDIFGYGLIQTHPYALRMQIADEGTTYRWDAEAASATAPRGQLRRGRAAPDERPSPAGG